jgi:hypothetical protein
MIEKIMKISDLMEQLVDLLELQDQEEKQLDKVRIGRVNGHTTLTVEEDYNFSNFEGELQYVDFPKWTEANFQNVVDQLELVINKLN